MLALFVLVSGHRDAGFFRKYSGMGAIGPIAAFTLSA
jgi:hypothetical protein